MHLCGILLLTAVAAPGIVLEAEAFISPSTLSCSRYRKHALSYSTVATKVPWPRTTIVMASGGKKRRRRKNSTSTPASSNAGKTRKPNSKGTPVENVGSAGPALSDVIEGDRDVESLFDDDWSGMPENTGMKKSNTPLPDISTYKPKSTPSPDFAQRRKKSSPGPQLKGSQELPDLSNFQSKLSPIVDREEEERARRLAERFEEGPIVKTLKTATWFAICALVLWEIWINSPWFPTATSTPIT